MCSFYRDLTTELYTQGSGLELMKRTNTKQVRLGSIRPPGDNIKRAVLLLCSLPLEANISYITEGFGNQKQTPEDVIATCSRVFRVLSTRSPTDSASPFSRYLPLCILIRHFFYCRLFVFVSFSDRKTGVCVKCRQKIRKRSPYIYESTFHPKQEPIFRTIHARN